MYAEKEKLKEQRKCMVTQHRLRQLRHSWRCSAMDFAMLPLFRGICKAAAYGLSLLFITLSWRP